MYQITEIAREFGLSRSTLLYYDRIALLSPSARSDAGYRLYSAKDRERLALICSYRQAGLGIDDIRRLLEKAVEGSEEVIRQRISGIGQEIRNLQARQHLLANMLKLNAGEGCLPAMDKQTWIAMLKAAGMDEQAMMQWHTEFERRAPVAHHDFLLSLGIDEDEAQLIRKRPADQPDKKVA